MDVSGSGKTTVGKLLAQQMAWTSIEAANVAKRSQDKALDDDDCRS